MTFTYILKFPLIFSRTFTLPHFCPYCHYFEIEYRPTDHAEMWNSLRLSALVEFLLSSLDCRQRWAKYILKVFEYNIPNKMYLQCHIKYILSNVFKI